MVVFILSALWWRRIRGYGNFLIGEIDWGGNWVLFWWVWPCSLNFSVEGQGCVPSLLLGLRPNYGGGNEDNVNVFQTVPCMHCYTQCPQPCSGPPLTYSCTEDSWTLMGKSGSMLWGHCSFFWVLVHTRFCLCPSRVCFPSPVKVLAALWWG